MSVSNELLREISEELKTHKGISITNDQVSALIKGTPVEEEIIEMMEIDTVIREEVIDLLSVSLLGEKWPMSYQVTSKQLLDFKYRFNEAAKKAGYKSTV